MNPQEIRIQTVKEGHSQGWSFIPLKGKIPQEKNWQKRKRETLSKAIEYAESGNIGIRTGKHSGGLVVVDIDGGADVSNMDFPDTVSIETGSGGRHLYYHYEKPIKNSVSKLAPNVDIRGDGGQVVAVGSIHPKTRQIYKYLVAPSERKIAELPQWIVEKIQPKRKAITHINTEKAAYVQAAIRNEIESVKAAQEGTRNNTLNISAFSLAQFIPLGLLTEEEIEIILLTSTDLPEAEARATIRSGIEAGREKPRVIPENYEKITPENEQVIADNSVLIPGTHETPTGRREVGTNTFAADVLKRLPIGSVYRRADTIVELSGSPGGRRLIPICADRLRIIVDSHCRLAIYKRIPGKGDDPDWYVTDFKPANRDHGRIVLEAGVHDRRIKEIDYLTNFPVYAPTWELSPPGLSHGIYYDEPDELKDISPAENMELIDDVLVDFPFASPQDRTNFIGLLLTPLVRPAIVGNVPLFLLMSSLPRTGKTKLAEEIVGGIWEGRHTPAMQLTGSEDERDKRILSLLIGGDTIVHIDNVSHYLDSPALASLITAKTYRGRLLGSSKVIDVKVNLTLIASGNNPKATNELVKRSVPIRLQPKTDRPETRSDFVHPDIFAHVLNNRHSLVCALIGMVEKWKKKDRPPGRKRMGGFESWANVVGGILDVNGLTNWLDNWGEFVAEADPEAEELKEFVKVWADIYPVGVPAQASDLFILADENDLFDVLLSRSTTDRGKQTIFGLKVLTKYQNSPVDKYIIRKGSRNRYYLEINADLKE